MKTYIMACKAHSPTVTCWMITGLCLLQKGHNGKVWWKCLTF